MAAATASSEPRSGLPQAEDERNEGSEEEEEVESDEEGDGSEVASLADLCEPDAVSDEDPTFDPAADGSREVETVLRSRMARMSISGRKDRKGSGMPKMGKEDIEFLSMVDKLMQDGQLEKLKVYECKAYLRVHKLRLSGKKEVLLNRIREHLEVKNGGGVMYPVSSFVLNCKGDACKGDVVMFEQNIYRRKKGASREVKGRLCGQRTNAGRIIKESYGTAKQQHTFTIEILWSKGYKPWPPLHPLLIKGRNLYKDKTMRQPWPDEEERNKVLQEKHTRGFLARKSREVRIHEKELEKMKRLNRVKESKSKEQESMNGILSQEACLQQKVELMGTVHHRIDEKKAPSLQHGEPGNTRQLLPSNTPTKKIFHYLQQPPYQQRTEVLLQEGTVRTYRPEVIDRQHPSLQHGEPGNTRHQQQISSGHTPQQTFQYVQQPPNHQNHNEVLPLEGTCTRRTYKPEFIDRQNNSYRTAEHGEPAFQSRGMYTQHAKTQQHGSNGHENAHSDHQLRQSLRLRNQDLCSRDQLYGHDYHDQRQMTQDQYHPQQNQHRNYNDQRQMARDQYHPRQNRHQNYYDHNQMTGNQYHPQQFRMAQHNQPPHQYRTPQRIPPQRSRLQPCRYYLQGRCHFGQNCRFSHDI